MKNKVKQVKLNIPIYDRTLIIIVTDNIEKSVLKCCPDDAEVTDYMLDGTLVHDEKGTMILIIPPDANINSICHEAFHIAIEVLGDAGLELTDSSDEAYAYLIGWLAEEIEKILIKTKI